MLKKILLLTFALLLLFNFTPSQAFLDKVENTTWLNNVIYDNLYVISENDFQDVVKVQIKDAPANTLFDVQVDWYGDGQPFIDLISTSTNSAGEINLTVPHTWLRWTPHSQDNWNYQVDFQAIPASEDHNDPSKFIGPATYTARVYYINTNLSNDASLSENQKVKKGTSVTFTCQNSSEMYYGLQANWPTGATLVNSKYASTNGLTSDYTLTYTPTLNTAGKYRVQCSNIGYEASPSTVTDFDFEVVDTFDILNIASTPNEVAKSNNFTWTSTAETCNVYNDTKSTNIGTGSKSGSSWSATVSSSNIRTTAGNQTFYIKCYDAIDYPATTLGTDPDPHTGWSSPYTVNITEVPVTSGSLTANPMTCEISAGDNACFTYLTWSTTNPVGTSEVTATGMTSLNGNSGTDVSAPVPYNSRTFYLYNNGGLLEQVTVTSSCVSGSTWNSGAGVCEITSCPVGQILDGGVCHNTFDITGISSNPNHRPGSCLTNPHINYTGNRFVRHEPGSWFRPSLRPTNQYLCL